MSLRDDVIEIWKAGVDAVDSARLVRSRVTLTRQTLTIGDRSVLLSDVNRVIVVGAGKAGAGMARGLEAALADLPPRIERVGFVNVPADCVESLDWIHLHPARPSGVNEPTEQAVVGTNRILNLLSTARSGDVCILLLSGGGSALLCSPVAGISLADKLQVTRLLATAGAPIQDLNRVRTWLSNVKGGGLLNACGADRLTALIISDVIGDPLPIIASGPTVPRDSTAHHARRLLEQYVPDTAQLPDSVICHLKAAESGTMTQRQQTVHCSAVNVIIGNNQTAVLAAAHRAAALGYDVVNDGSDHAGDAASEGSQFFRQLQQLHGSGDDRQQRICLIQGGEPTVRLANVPNVPATSRRGGRNQEFVLGMVSEFCYPEMWKGMAVLSGGTDGEDGPTDAAGAVADAELIDGCLRKSLRPRDYLAVNNAYPFFRELGGLLMTGPTHTNVMDLRVGLKVYERSGV
ncbi:MAG: DUF4147 domain-containing protein [Planctomycetaceae bacterium]|nr:DUF4147 domain-containing protein [Planctomycetaceae bacterium]